eukprot:TRINITY_DN13103_c0_g1_i1.p1 TRINITY_DN13103_c0_g1~~TRINITY_DN13103_c0_g1_i1.p1  ORF type:complete len:651 (+),score=119.67 TRINITY_DN13103_c0_g1_i1:71-2023(+)
MDGAVLKEFAAFAEKLADVARKEILPYWRQPLKVESKVEPGRPVPESPVTIADRKAEDAMRRLINEKYPHHGISGEEMGDVRMDAEYVWVLDPIDGTKSFITGKPLFGTLIGLCRHGVPVVGVIDQCVLKERWVGIVGEGTTLNGEPVRARGVDKLSEAMLYATTPHMFAQGHESECFAAVRDSVKRPLYGTDCYAYALVASGFGADLVVEADLGLYDYSALVPVVKGAGGVMTDWNGKELCIGRHKESRGRVVAAANKSLHEQAVKLLKDPPGQASCMKPHLRTLEPYLPPLSGRSDGGMLLLDFNERTVPVPSHVTDALKKFIDDKGLQCYPSYDDLQNKIAKYARVPMEQVMFTNGSDQGIDLVTRCCCPEGSEVIIPSPTFAMYEQAALTEGLTIKRPWFTIDKGFPKDEVLGMIGPKTSMVVFSNPNNPTATAIPRETIIEIAEKAPQCAMLVDECYYEFMDADSTLKDVVERLPNVFVCRTFSKTWGIPSLRLGYLISAKANISALCSVRGPYDVNTLARVAVIAALDNPGYVFDYVKELNGIAKPKFEEFLRSRGIRFWPSSANYIFCYFANPTHLEAELRKQKILVRPKKDAEGVLGLRVTIGTAEQTARVIAALGKLLDAQGANGTTNGTNGCAAKRQKVN